LILQVGIVLLGHGAVIDIVTRLSTIVTAVFTGVTWGSVGLGSLLLSVAELEIFPKGFIYDGFIVQRPVEDCWDELGTFFFTKQNFLLVPLPEAKPACLFLYL
jgi:hypothetical protein